MLRLERDEQTTRREQPMCMREPYIVRDEMLEDGVEREGADLRLLVLQRAQIPVLHWQIFFPAICGHGIRRFDTLHMETLSYEQLTQAAPACAIIHDEPFRVIIFERRDDALIVRSRGHATPICIALVMSGSGILSGVRTSSSAGLGKGWS